MIIFLVPHVCTLDHIQSCLKKVPCSRVTHSDHFGYSVTSLDAKLTLVYLDDLALAKPHDIVIGDGERIGMIIIELPALQPCISQALGVHGKLTKPDWLKAFLKLSDIHRCLNNATNYG